MFLHGFEYTAAQPVSSCQILIGNVTSNATGVFFDVASDSSLNFIYISIFRCNSTKELIAFGTVQSFQKANTANLLLPLKHSVSMSTAQFYGLTSFDLVSSGKDILFTSSLDKVNNKFILKTNTAFKSV